MGGSSVGLVIDDKTPLTAGDNRRRQGDTERVANGARREPPRRRVAHDVPVAEDDDPVGRCEGCIEVVENGDDGPAGGRPTAKGAECVRHVGDIEVGCWLVEEEDLRILRLEGGQPDPLSLTVGQRPKTAMSQALKAEALQGMVHGRVVPTRRLPPSVVGEAREANDVVNPVGAGDANPSRRQERDPPAALSQAKTGEAPIIQKHAPSRRTSKTGHDSEQRGLTRAVRPDHGHEFAGADRQADRIHCVAVAEP